jgi:imidazolonepropionase-like amidohydrolase
MRLTLLAILIAAALPAQASDLKALQCGNVFDSKSAKLIGSQTIVVEKNTIKSVSPGKVAIDGAQILDLSQMTCMPGFIDMHVHMGQQQSPQRYSEGFRLDDVDFAFRAVGYAEKTLQAGFTSVRDLGGEISLHLRDAIDQGTLRGPRIYAAGKSIATTGGHADPTNGLNSELSHLIGPPGPTEGVINSVDDARQAVRQRYKNGSDVIKITATGGVLSYAKSGDAPQFTVEEVRVIVDTAKDYGYTVAAHAHGKEGMKRAILGGVTTIEHGTYMDDEIFRLMKERGTWYVPTITAGKFVADKSMIDGYFPEIVRPKAARIGSLIQTTFANAYKSGVKIAFGTDMGVGPHGENASEFIYMTEVGMPANLALQTATYNAAQILAPKELGQIQSGFKADVIAVVGNPLADITLTKKIAFVMKDGVVYKEAKP